MFLIKIIDYNVIITLATDLVKKSLFHALSLFNTSAEKAFQISINSSRYSPSEFIRIMIDTKAFKHFTAGYSQYIAL